ncbi:helix-turn-helix domain-containing protein [Cystobacter fuscus]|uniref:helix-turn-helix domain-containing protein n=1 Tax=Cystobacter fuscus TaxID=43 RepID=UPI0009DD5D5C|nr:LysR family transcriptional regulator [Cystobacter fuscus]
MSVFLAVAEVRSLRGAGDRLGVSGSAVSQAPRRLEDRFGVTLVQRTTCSIRPAWRSHRPGGSRAALLPKQG